MTDIVDKTIQELNKSTALLCYGIVKYLKREGIESVEIPPIDGYVITIQLENTRLNDAKKLADSIEDVIADIATRDNGRVFWEMVNDSEKAPVTMGDLRKILTLIHEATPPKQSEMSE